VLFSVSGLDVKTGDNQWEPVGSNADAWRITRALP